MEELKKLFKDFNGELHLYIEGSQGVAPAEMQVVYGVDFSSVEELEDVFRYFIDENALEYVDDYLEECDGDEDEALGTAVCDSGNWLLGTTSDNLTHIFDGFTIYEKIEL